MLLSQVLLTAFALYWLSDQYKEEKGLLLKDLDSKYMLAYNTTVDTFLLKNYIKPALGDSTVNYFRYKRPARKILLADSVKVHRGGDSIIKRKHGKDGVVTININTREDMPGIIATEEIEETEHNLLLQSVRLIVQHADDSNRIHISTMHGQDRSIDTMLFISSFEAQLEKDKLDIHPVWVESESDSVFSVRSGSFIIGEGLEEVPSVGFSGSAMLLLGRIAPQILFVFVLIILSGSAFFLAYRSMRKQALLNDTRSSFISNISHELKTPVSTVKVAIEALKNIDLKKDHQTAAEYLSMSSKELKRLELLITKVLDNSIIEQDSSILRFEKVNLPDIIEAAIESLAPKIKDSNAVVSFSPGSDLSLSGDPLYLQGVIINLIDNSLKYGNGNPEIQIELSRSESDALIAVTDNGPGIPEEYISRVFEKFFRLPTQDRHNVKGYGLDLSFAALIVEMHGGSISVKNNKSGCTFTIRLPLG